jgi:hypothetical protein
MAAKPKKAAARKSPKEAAPAAEDEVDAFMHNLVHPLRADIEAVRKIVLGADASISDGVKWNSLSFRRSDWFATVNLRSKDAVQLVFHTGAKVKDTPELKIPDPEGLMLWVAKDRALVTLGNGKALKANAKAFEAIVKAWLKYV